MSTASLNGAADPQQAPGMMEAMQMVGMVGDLLQSMNAHLAFQSGAMALLIGQTDPETGAHAPGIVQEQTELLRGIAANIETSTAALAKFGGGNPLSLFRGKRSDDAEPASV